MHIVPVPSFPVTDSCDDPGEDRAVSREELQALLDVLKRDQPYDDEAPELDDALFRGPALEDEQWWAEQTRTERHRLLQHAHVSPTVSVSLTESANPLGVEFRYACRTYRAGVEVSFEGFDSLATAQAIFRHLVTRLPDGPGPAIARAWAMPGEDLSDDHTGAFGTGGASW